MGVFTELEVFQDTSLNALLDKIYERYGIDNLFIFGGVARILDGEVSYRTKDIDIVTSTEYAFYQIAADLQDLFPEMEIKFIPGRCILYASRVIEIWKRDWRYHHEYKIYKNKIPYLITKK